jgi:MerR family transcriptional regulator, light-induced transcriptional regulator
MVRSLRSLDERRESDGAAARALARLFLEAIRAADAVRAYEISRDALDGGMTFSGLYCEVITPAMHEIGELWAAGAITVADEHLATALTHKVLTTLRAHTLAEGGRAAGSRRGRALLATVEGEMHTLGLRMAADLLEDDGYEAIYLGPDVPTRDLKRALEEMEPAVLALSATMPESGRTLEAVLAELRALHPELKLLAGGGATELGGRAVALDSLIEHAAPGRLGLDQV